MLTFYAAALFFNAFYIITNALVLTTPSTNAPVCRDPWAKLQQCLRSKLQQKELTAEERAAIRTKLTTCYIQQGCEDPFPSIAEMAAKQKCFLPINLLVRTGIQTCVHRSFPDFALASGNEIVSGTHGQEMLSLKNANCLPLNQTALSDCVVTARGRVSSMVTADDPCSMRYSCYTSTAYTRQCYDRRTNVKSKLCTCSQQLNTATWQNQYRNCLKTARFPLALTKTDYNLMALGSFKDSKNWFCTNSIDICGGPDYNKGIYLSNATATNGNMYSNLTAAFKGKNTIINPLLGTVIVDVDAGTNMGAGGLFPEPSVVFGPPSGTMLDPKNFWTLMSNQFHLTNTSSTTNNAVAGSKLFGQQKPTNLFGAGQNAGLSSLLGGGTAGKWPQSTGGLGAVDLQKLFGIGR